MSFLSRLRGGGEPTFHDLHKIPSREDLFGKENVVNSGEGNNLFTIASNKSNKATSFKGSDKIFLQHESNDKTNMKNSQNPLTAHQPLQRAASTGGMSIRSIASTSAGNSVKDTRFASQRAVTATATMSTAPVASTDSWYSQAMFGNSIEPDDDASTVLSGGSVQTFQSHHLHPMVTRLEEPAAFSPPSSARSIQSYENTSVGSHLGDYQYRSNAMPRLPSQQNFCGRGQGIAQQKPSQQKQQNYPSLSSKSSFSNPYTGAEDLNDDYNEQEQQEMYHPGAYYDADYEQLYPNYTNLEPGEDEDEFPASASQIDQDTIEMVFSKARHDRQDYVLDMLISGRFNPNSRDQHGNTLLHVCAQNNHRALASKIIKQCGGVDKIDINAKNKKKFTPLDYCEKYGHMKFRMWLATMGAKYGNHGKEQFQTSRNT